MADVHEKMVKMSDAKGEKGALKRNHVQHLKTSGQSSESEGSSPSFDVTPDSPIGPAKKQKILISPKGRRRARNLDP